MKPDPTPAISPEEQAAKRFVFSFRPRQFGTRRLTAPEQQCLHEAMKDSEANTILFLRCHFKCTYSKVGGITAAIWGISKCRELAGVHETGATLGEALVRAAEERHHLVPFETDRTVIAELFCARCGSSQWSLCYPADTAKECVACRNMASYIHSSP